ncbi:MAG: ATP-binding protein [bacterium]|nr:ATP-binding protein [bacterium]
MNEIVVLSGKGGTGKTSITGALASVAEEKVVFADSDVDASNLHLILGDEIIKQSEFSSGYIATVDSYLCTGCNICEQECAYDSIHVQNKRAFVDTMFCEGCGLCAKLCPEKAISMDDLVAGNIIYYKTRFGIPLLGASMTAKRERSGKLVSEVKSKAREMCKESSADYLLVDGPPGIGCPAIASLGGANYIILVTEPTLSGFEDLKRVFSLIKFFRIKTGIIINKSDINETIADDIKAFAEENRSIILDEFRFDSIFIKSVRNRKTVSEESKEMKVKIENLWKKIKEEAK